MSNRVPVLGAGHGNAGITQPDSIFEQPGKALAPQWLVNTVARLWTGNGARRTGARRAGASCELDLGPDQAAPCSAQLVDISLSGCVIRLPSSLDPASHMYNIATLDLAPCTDAPFKLYGTIVRVDSDTAWRDCASVLASLRFTALDESNRERLREYIKRFGAAPGS